MCHIRTLIIISDRPGVRVIAEVNILPNHDPCGGSINDILYRKFEHAILVSSILSQKFFIAFNRCM